LPLPGIKYYGGENRIFDPTEKKQSKITVHRVEGKEGLKKAAQGSSVLIEGCLRVKKRNEGRDPPKGGRIQP